MFFEYDYECQNCKHVMTVNQKPSDKKRFKKCPECGKMKLERVMFACPDSFVEREATTIGQMADRNRKKMSKDQIAEKEEKLSKKKPKKDMGVWDDIGQIPKDKQKNLNTPEKVKKYIMEGK